MIRAALAALALSLPVAAAAHTFWLEAEAGTHAPGEEVRVEFRIGDTGEQASPWGVYWERIASLRLAGPDGVSDQQAALRVTTRAEQGRAEVLLPGEGSYVLAFESNPSFSDLEADRFDAYVASEGLTAIAAHRANSGAGDTNGTELYSRRAKVLLQAGERLTGNVTRPLGQTLEIVPLQNPLALDEGAPLDLMVLFRGEPLIGAQLSAQGLDGSGEAERFTTSADGVVRVAAPGDEAMLYAVVWGVPAPRDRRADYITIFASLTIAGG